MMALLMDVNARDTDGNQSLHLAVRSRSLEAVKILVEEHGAVMDSQNNAAKTPLELSCEENITAYLSDQMFRIEQLRIAVKQGDIPNIQRGLNQFQNAILQKDNSGNTVLHVACENGQYDAAVFLLKQPGVDIHAYNNFETQPLHLASLNGHFDVVKLLAENGANVRAKGYNDIQPIHLAAFGGHMEIVRHFVEKYGVDINSEDMHGAEPLDYATSNNHMHIVKYLKSMGATNKKKRRYFNAGILTVSCLWIVLAAYYIMPILFFSTANGYLGIMKFIVERCGAELGSAGEDGSYNYELLHMAVANNQLDVAKYLIEKHGANVTVKDENDLQPIHHAVANGNLELTKLLVKHGADVNAKGQHAYTPLHLAASNGDLSIIQFLVEKGADVKAMEKIGKTAVDIALGKHDHIVQYLKSIHEDSL